MSAESNGPVRRAQRGVEGPGEDTDSLLWFVYIARARTGRLYVGMTTDHQSRVERHNTGRGSYFAQLQGPFDVSLPFISKSDARMREAQIKVWTRVQKEKLIRGELVEVKENVPLKDSRR